MEGFLHDLQAKNWRKTVQDLENRRHFGSEAKTHLRSLSQWSKVYRIGPTVIQTTYHWTTEVVQIKCYIHIQ